jgi:hypothetical protein
MALLSTAAGLLGGRKWLVYGGVALAIAAGLGYVKILHARLDARAAQEQQLRQAVATQQANELAYQLLLEDERAAAAELARLLKFEAARAARLNDLREEIARAPEPEDACDVPDRVGRTLERLYRDAAGAGGAEGGAGKPGDPAGPPDPTAGAGAADGG